VYKSKSSWLKDFNYTASTDKASFDFGDIKSAFLSSVSLRYILTYIIIALHLRSSINPVAMVTQPTSKYCFILDDNAL